MALEDLEQIEFANGLAMIIINVITITLGLLIMSKYLKYKSRPLLFVGFTIIGLSTPWWPGATSFILVALDMAPLSAEMYFIMGNILIPVALVTWIAGFTELKYPEKEKVAVTLALITSIIYLIFFFYYLGADKSMIGALKGKNSIDVKYDTVVSIFYLVVLVLLLVTGYLFARTSMKSGDPEIELKGKLLLIAFLLYFIGAMLDTFLYLEIETLILFRGFELASVIVFYWGFVLPKFMKKLFIKEK